MADAPAVLVAALSARALAAAARRAGYRPLAADLFQDVDTRKIAERSEAVAGNLSTGLRAGALLEALERLAEGQGPGVEGFVYGAGFEDRPALLARIGRRFTLLGNRPAQIEQIKDPRRFFAVLDRLAVPHPPVAFSRPDDTADWLIKRAAASGGGHVRPARDGMAVTRQDYFQRRVSGRPVSVLFLADGRRALTLGFSEQWPSPAGLRTPFRFGGAVRPAEISGPQAAALGRAVRAIVAATGLVGLNSADLLLRPDGFDLIEVNPRPGATLDIFDMDRDDGSDLFALHCRACRGHLPGRWTPPSGAAACAIAYAARNLVVPAGFAWPRWSADRPAGGTSIPKGAPICTVSARAPDPALARRRVDRRIAAVHAALETGRREIAGTRTAALQSGQFGI